MRILIIEDDPDIASNLYDFLEAAGHTVDAAPDGITGLHLASSGQFDCILLDLGLPRLDGNTLCRRLREDAHVETPVLMITARDTLDDKLTAARIETNTQARQKLYKEIQAYVDQMAPDIAAERSARLKKAGAEKIGFAWGGETERGKKHYYRIQGPTFLIEYDNTQNDGNHVHSVWRDFERDFGRDLLRDHLKSGH